MLTTNLLNFSPKMRLGALATRLRIKNIYWIYDINRCYVKANSVIKFGLHTSVLHHLAIIFLQLNLPENM